jgi:hypothetical protein
MALQGGVWSVSYTDNFKPRAEAPYIHWTGGWLVPTLTVDALWKRKISSPCQVSNFDSSIVHHVVYLLYWPHNLSSQKIQRNTTIHILLHSGKVRNNWLFFIICCLSLASPSVLATWWTIELVHGYNCQCMKCTELPLVSSFPVTAQCT